MRNQRRPEWLGHRKKKAKAAKNEAGGGGRSPVMQGLVDAAKVLGFHPSVGASNERIQICIWKRSFWLLFGKWSEWGISYVVIRVA